MSTFRTPRSMLAAIAVAAALPAAALAKDSGGTGGVGTTPSTPGAGTSGDSIFPLRAKHTYGDGLGAGRGHQGQDLLAKCGKPIVAAEPGRVRLVKYQASGAGNYAVLSTKGKSDQVYMHMAAPSKLREGARVQAGDLVGRVGSTGRSTACHLHFEMWSKPGWYRGGSVLDPTPYLKSLDKRG